MNASGDEGREIMRYLLGEEMSETAQTVIENRYIHDSRYYARVASVEDRLIADYLQGRLHGQQRQRFEQVFMASPHRKRRVEVQRGMLDCLTKARAVSVFRPGRRLSWIAAALASVSCVALSFYAFRLRGELSDLRHILAARCGGSN